MIRADVAILLLVAVVPSVGAQDFSGPRLAGPPRSGLGFVETGLVPPRGNASLEAATARWFGLPDLATRMAAAGAGWLGLRAAVGISQTGDVETGWSAVGVGCGAATSSGGVGMRAVVRRDRAPEATATRLGPGVGAELGAGAWVLAAQNLRVWASAPQWWRRGAAPPLLRALEIGATFETGAFEVWIARTAPSRPETSATRSAGVGLAAGPWTLWIESRDRPLRATLGFAARRRRLFASTAIESHPVLGETVRLSIGADRSGGSR